MVRLPRWGVNKRQFSRMPCEEALNIRLDDTDPFEGALVVDLSQGGMKIESHRFISLASCIELEWKYSPNAQAYAWMGKVVWIKILSESGRYQLGIDFRKAHYLVKRQIGHFMIRHKDHAIA